MMPQYYAYDAALHCPAHAFARFGKALYQADTVDSEENPIGAVFSWEVTADDYCDECSHEKITARNARRGR